ncbi:MAG: 4a-hydroxytetrahydrobiopterin dehydratase [Bacteroidota bacterium]|nr:MAG: 4a-hydroxytetrahydrobiopterin dehydratase [Bacteroidota bacterium]
MRLSPETIQHQLSALPHWVLIEDALCAEFNFSGFSEALAFILRVGLEAEKADRHPEIRNIYNRVSFRLSTHEAEGITQRDFELAARINTLLPSSTGIEKTN